MKQLLSFILCALFLSGLLPGSRAFATNSIPFFINGSTQTLTICENSGLISINGQLSVLDSDAGQTEVWSVKVSAVHGTLVVSDTVIATGDTLLPSGLSYTPATGFSGTDSFTVQIWDGVDSSATTVYVTVSALPAAGAITGSHDICVGNSHDLSDTVTGGMWSVVNPFAIISSTGTVTGDAAGTDSVLYTAINSCGAATDTFLLHVHSVPSAGVISGTDSLCSGSTDTLGGVTPGGMWHSSSSIVALVNAEGHITGIEPGITTISYIVINSCGSDTARHDVSVELPLLPGSIIGADVVCQFNVTLLLALEPNGTWTSSNYFVASVLEGLVLGITPGTATITYSLDNACGVTSVTQDITVLSLAECPESVNAVSNKKPLGVYVYPVPNDGDFTFDLFSDKDEPVNIVITNVTGVTVKTLTTITNKDEHIQLAQPAGIYFLSSTTASGTTVTKFLINK